MNARIEDLKRQLRQLDELAAAGTLPSEQAGAARAKLESLLSRGLPLRDALSCAEAIGDPALIPWILEVMAPLEHRRIAAETFRAITGVDIAGRLSTTRPDEAPQQPKTPRPAT